MSAGEATIIQYVKQLGTSAPAINNAINLTWIIYVVAQGNDHNSQPLGEEYCQLLALIKLSMAFFKNIKSKARGKGKLSVVPLN